MEANNVVARTLTIVVLFDDKYPPDWIWDCHKNRSFLNGVLITSIAEGDQMNNTRFCENCCQDDQES